MNFIAVVVYLLISAALLVKGMEFFDKKEKAQYRRMVGHFPRPPGYHLSEQRSDMTFDLIGFMFAIVLAPFFVFIILNQFHWSYTLLASIPVQAGIVWRMSKFMSKVQAVKKGHVAELKVGMALSSKLPHSCKVYHDVQLAENHREGSNVDHLILTPQEIYVIDTKYRRASKVTDSNTLYYNGSNIQFSQGGFKTDQDLKTIQSVKKQLEGYLKREGFAKIDIPIRCVLIYPGWQVDYSEALGKRAQVQVSSATAFINRIRNKYERSSIHEGSLLDRLDQHFDAKNIVEMEKL